MQLLMQFTIHIIRNINHSIGLLSDVSLTIIRNYMKSLSVTANKTKKNEGDSRMVKHCPDYGPLVTYKQATRIEKEFYIWR